MSRYPGPVSTPTVGVFALQGDVREHIAALERVGAETLEVRRPEELTRCHGLILPGGESTTMAKLARIFDLFTPLREAIAGGLPTFGTCAGMILLADRIVDGAAGQETLGGLDITVRRNAFGRQVDSFEADLDVTGLDAPFHAVNVLADPEIRASLPRYSNWPTFPQLFIQGELIGGCDIVVELFEQNQLQQMVADAATA